MRTIMCSWTLAKLAKTRWQTMVAIFVFLIILMHLMRGLVTGNKSTVRRRFSAASSSKFIWDQGSFKGPVPYAVPSRPWEYCNSPYLPVHGEEGTVPVGFELKSVYILIRHGDRTPMTTFPQLTRHDFDCRLNPSMFPNHTNFQGFVNDLRKQQDERRANDPFKSFPVYPMVKHCDNAQLTAHGVAQHLGMGKYLGEIYNKKLGLLKEDFKHYQLHLRSTKYTRTYQSALAFLYGFLPKFHLSRLKFEPSIITFCNPKFITGGCNCRFHNVIHRNIPMEVKILGGDQWTDGLKDACDSLGLNVKPHMAPSIMDTLNGRFCHGAPLPCVNGKPCNADEIMNGVWEIIDRNGRLQIQSDSYQKSQRLLMHPMLKEIANMMSDRINSPKKNRTKFVLFSGHDITVTALNTALGVHKGFWPPYASRIVFELYSSKGSGDIKYFIKVLFNGKDVTKFVRFCKEELLGGLCPFKRFMDFVQVENLKEMFGVEKYAEACALHKP